MVNSLVREKIHEIIDSTKLPCNIWCLRISYLCPQHRGIKTKVHGPSVLLATGPPIGPREQGSGYPRAFQQQVAAKGKQRSLLVVHCLSAIYHHFSPWKKATSISSLIYYIDVGLNLIWILFFRFRTLLLIYILDYSDILPFAVHPLFAVAVLSLIQAKVPRPARKC
jgi:hypothetical protein